MLLLNNAGSAHHCWRPTGRLPDAVLAVGDRWQEWRTEGTMARGDQARGVKLGENPIRRSTLISDALHSGLRRRTECPSTSQAIFMLATINIRNLDFSSELKDKKSFCTMYTLPSISSAPATSFGTLNHSFL